MKTKIILIAITGLIAYSCSQKPTYQYQIQNPALSFEERVDNIVSLLTVEEKIQQIHLKVRRRCRSAYATKI